MPSTLSFLEGKSHTWTHRSHSKYCHKAQHIACKVFDDVHPSCKSITLSNHARKYSECVKWLYDMYCATNMAHGSWHPCWRAWRKHIPCILYAWFIIIESHHTYLRSTLPSITLLIYIMVYFQRKRLWLKNYENL